MSNESIRIWCMRCGDVSLSLATRQPSHATQDEAWTEGTLLAGEFACQSCGRALKAGERAIALTCWNRQKRERIESKALKDTLQLLLKTGSSDERFYLEVQGSLGKTVTMESVGVVDLDPTANEGFSTLLAFILSHGRGEAIRLFMNPSAVERLIGSLQRSLAVKRPLVQRGH